MIAPRDPAHPDTAQTRPRTTADIIVQLQCLAADYASGALPRASYMTAAERECRTHHAATGELYCPCGIRLQ